VLRVEQKAGDATATFLPPSLAVFPYEPRAEGGGCCHSQSKVQHLYFTKGGMSMADWAHSPMHQLTEAGAYIVTCGTYLKRHHFRGAERLRFLCDALLGRAAEYGWNLQAWAVFSTIIIL
jgi:hypothetical protein